MWVVKAIDDEGNALELNGRLVRIVNAVIAHGGAVNVATRGNIRVSWSDGETKAVVETHFAAESEPRTQSSSTAT